MTMPTASFAVVAPPVDGLVLAFTSARRRRNSKAAVCAFGGAVAIASVLSFLAPPGQNLVQEPVPPAHGGLLPGLSDPPRHGAPLQVRTPVTPAQLPTVISPASMSTQTHQPDRLAAGRPAVAQQDTCTKGRMIVCAVVHPVVEGGPTMRAGLCPGAASVTVEYDTPQVGPTRASVRRTVDAGGGCRA